LATGATTVPALRDKIENETTLHENAHEARAQNHGTELRHKNITFVTITSRGQAVVYRIA